MNKKDLIHRVAEAAGLTLDQAGKSVDAMLGAMTSTLARGGDVRLAGFGTFKVGARKATTGRNPRTGEKLQIPASMRPKFKAGKALKEAVAHLPITEAIADAPAAEDLITPPPPASSGGWRDMLKRN